MILKNNIITIFILLMLGGGMTSCNPTQYLKKDEILINKTKIKFTDTKSIKRPKKLASELYTFAKPDKNVGLFKLRLRLFNAIKEPKDKSGLKYWLKYKLGEPPSLFTPKDVNRNRLVMQKYLLDNGYFGNNVQFDTLINERRANITYLITTHGQYTINDIIYSDDSTSVGVLFSSNSKNSFLEKGKPYEKLNLDKERLRLATLAGDAGYFDFNDDYIYYFVDTLENQLKLDLYVEVKPNEDGTQHSIYKLGKTTVFSNYDLNEPSLSFSDTIAVTPNFDVVRNRKILETKTLDRMMLQSSGDIFSKTNQNISVNHLLDLNVFKFVNLKYQKDTDSLSNTLNRYFYLTPDLDQNVSLEIELNNRTGSFFGTAATFSYQHRNLSHGAEKLNISLAGGIETQIGNKIALINTADLNLQVKYSLPRFLVPFKLKTYSGYYVPSTNLILRNNFQDRAGFFAINKSAFSFGYDWKETKKKRHQLTPIDIEYVRLINTSESFNTLLDETPRLRLSFQNVLIAGLNYTFNYSNLNTDVTKANFSFKGEMKLAGNTIYAVQKLISSEQQDTYTLIGQPFSQFARFQTDVRANKKLRFGSLYSRFNPAIGIPYGNSNLLPYSEQFFVGGANSIRAFPLRGLGPGSFVPEIIDGDFAEQFFDQTGDIRLELNVEYRFDLFSYLKGAVFLDVGNIWLLEDDTRPQGVFQWNSFYKEIAIGSGFGLRVDFEFAVIRFDLGIPLRKPYLDEGFQWTLNRMNLRTSNGRQENLNLVFGIGYPF